MYGYEYSKLKVEYDYVQQAGLGSQYSSQKVKFTSDGKNITRSTFGVDFQAYMLELKLGINSAKRCSFFSGISLSQQF
jgi:hypothetical protein